MGPQPEIIKKLDYGIDKLGFIRQALAGYAGGSAIINELLQNADDAKATEVLFQFQSNNLLAWNNSIFEKKDWENITKIASGGKRNDRGKIGTWGTGFLSVFHLTDIPEVHSTGIKLTLDPRENFAYQVQSKIKDGTGFQLKWRKEISDISSAIGAAVWDNSRIDNLKEELAISIYKQIIFYRNIRVIEVYEGDPWKEKLLYRVTRLLKSSFEQNGCHGENWEIEYQRFGVQTRRDTWLYYRRNISKDLMVQGLDPKDTEIGIAFPIENRDWLTKNIPGILYNFQPTPIQTGFNFQINGAFYPDSTRQKILIDQQTQNEQSIWNKNVIFAIGNLFVDVISDIRDNLGEPRRFYEILPTQPPQEKFLNPIYEAFCRAASTEKIVFSSLGRWSIPRDVVIGKPGSRLPELASDYKAIVPLGVPQTFRNFLTDILKIHWLEWKDVIEIIKGRDKPGVSLIDAHPMINSIEKLSQLYVELPQNPTIEQKSVFCDVIACLGEDGNLWPFSFDIWRATEATRLLLLNTNLVFVSFFFQNQYSKLFENLLVEFKGAQFVEWLAMQKWPSVPITLSDFPPLFEDINHILDLIKFIYSDLQETNRELLRKIPIIYTEADHLCTVDSKVFFHGDAAERADLQILGIQFVHPNWAADEEIRAVYERAGVYDLKPRDVIQALNNCPLSQMKLSDEELVQILQKIYGYFYRNKSQIDEKSKADLREIPICLTQGSRLTSVQKEQTNLHLPGDETLTKSPVLKSLKKLQLDDLIHSDVLSGRHFFTEILGLSQLSEINLIRDVILKHYHDQRLDHSDRRNLLFFINDYLRSLSSSQSDTQNDIWIDLRKSSIILCSNGEYHIAKHIYFACPAIDTVFGTEYLKLDLGYEIPTPNSNDDDQMPFHKNKWYALFKNLGVNESPSPFDLVNRITQLTKENLPEPSQVESVRHLYDFLNREINDNKIYIDSLDIKRLSEMAWLPARNRSDRWHFPREIYQASQTILVGDQAPLMIFRESLEKLRSILGMPSYPETRIVAKHLLHLGRQKKPLEENELRIYQDLGNRWSNIDLILQQQLMNSEVVWSINTQRYWRPDQVFMANFEQLFGKRRSYMQSPGGEAYKFLTNIGVRDVYKDNDCVSILIEIANEYPKNVKVREEDYLLIFSNLNVLSQNSDPKIIEQIKDVNFMADENHYLHKPGQIVLIDRIDLLDKFEKDSFPYLYQNNIPESLYRFLRKLDMPLLSELISRRLVNVQEKQIDTRLTSQIQMLEDPIKRLAKSIYSKDEEAEKQAFHKIESLVKYEILSCNQIVVEYALQNFNGCFRSIVGHQDMNAKSLLDESNQKLYVCRIKGNLDNVQLALEIESILFPGSKISMTIENLLGMKPAEVEGYLDKHEVPKLFFIKKLLSPSQFSQEHLEKWEIPSRENTDEDEVGFETVKFEGEQSNNIPIQKAISTLSEQEIDLDDELEIEETIPISPRNELEADIQESNLDSEQEFQMGTNEQENHSEDLPPIFNGIIRPEVPILSNDYDDLFKRYNLKYSDIEQSDEEDDINTSDRVDADQRWGYDGTNEEADVNVTCVRFTLTFVNRYEGFLPLHQRARQMLLDCPSRLICDTDFPDWSFDLYVDYERQIIYNQESLPYFLELFKIPAGGIIYLERVHENRCRLFWKNDPQHVEDVVYLELGEDGYSVNEIPSIDVPCEVSEYVFRSEKRLEDPEALFRQAVGKKGVFQTLCEVFGSPGNILSIRKIHQDVMRIRQVASSTIISQLEQRPCFVKLEDDYWCFDPDKGMNIPKKEKKHTKLESTQPINIDDKFNKHISDIHPQLPKEHKEQYQEIVSHNSTNNLLLLKDFRKEWEYLGDLFEEKSEDQCAKLISITDEMITLANRWKSRLYSLSKSEGKQTDDTLANFWMAVEKKPQDQNNIKLLEQRIGELFDSNIASHVISQLQYLLVKTTDDIRPFFYRSLVTLANNAFQHELYDQSLTLYQFLMREGAGNFDDKIEKINQQNRVLIQLEELKKETDPLYRLVILQDAWKESPEFPTLRIMIQKEVQQSIINQSKLIHTNIENGQIKEIYEQFINWSDVVLPLSSIWKKDPKITTSISEFIHKIFIKLYDQACNGDKEYYYKALQVANVRTLNVQDHVPVPDYVDTMLNVSESFEIHNEIPTAIAVLGFGLFMLTKRNRSPEKYLKYRVTEYSGRLFEQIELLTLADDYYHQAVKLASIEQSQRLNHRRYTLSERTKNAPPKIRETELQKWRIFLENLKDKREFMNLVDIKIYEEYISQIALS